MTKPRKERITDLAEKTGWKIHPVRANTKIPALTDWPSLASDDATQIECWARDYPDCNWGIVTGTTSKIIVVDIDPRNGGDASIRKLEADHGEFPITIRVKTGGGGEHIYFRLPSTPARWPKAIADGIDIKADGGQVIAAGSAHPDGGTYEWVEGRSPWEIGLAEAPDWLVELGKTTGRVSDTPLRQPRLSQPPEHMDRLVERCQLLREMEAGTIPFSGGDGHSRRIWLANNLLAFGDAGRDKVHAILSAHAADYDRNTTDKHLHSLKQRSGGNCRTVQCPHYGDGGCRALQDLQRERGRIDAYKSPIAFAYAGNRKLENFENTDLGNAKRLVHYYGDSIRYCFPWKSWLVWSGNRWARDDTGEIQRRAKLVVDKILLEAVDARSDGRKKELAAWANRTQSKERIKATVELASSENGVPVTPDELDKDSMLLNVMNGTIDLRTGILYPHDGRLLLTKLAPVEFDPDAECPLWIKFLDRVTDGSRRKQEFLQDIAGYALTGDIREQKIFFFHGGGENGKSTFLEVIRDLMGEYAMNTPTDTLMAKKGNGIPNDIARLKGARFVTAVETEDGRRLSESLIKQLTGGDMITARFLHAEFFEYRPQFKIIMSGNHKPEIRGTDKGIWRRLCLVPFTVTITEAEKDLTLPEKLRAELSGILNWALEGCLRWQKQGLDIPADVINATDDYRREMDLFDQFLTERFTTGVDLEERAMAITEEYRRWSGDNKISTRKIAGLLKQKGYQSAKKTDGNRWLGLKLIPWEPR